MLPAPPPPAIALTPGVVISRSVRVQPRTYTLTDGGRGMVRVTGHDFTLDFRGAKIVGPGKGTGKGQGIGLHVEEARNVIIQNADVSDCQWGLVVERSQNVRLVGCHTSHNADLPPGTVIDESGAKPEDEHGGGVLLRDSQQCRIEACVSQYQWDGLDVVRSHDNIILNSDFSFNGNWGVHFWSSSRNLFRNNRAVWCTTGAGTLYQSLSGWPTYDAQAVGIDHASCENTIEGNDLRFGGDGIFIRANEGPITPGTVVPPRNGSHRNRLLNNDCSFSPNNAIEVDLVDDTVIEGNNCSYSNYGMWLGYSRRCIVRRNICLNDSSHAVEIENGQDDVFEYNIFGCDTPRTAGELVYLRQNGRDNTPSGGYVFRHNLFYGAATGLRLTKTELHGADNTFVPNDDKSVTLNSDGQAKMEWVAGENAPLPTLAIKDVAAGDSTAENKKLRAGHLRPGSEITLHVAVPKSMLFPPVVEMNGIPLWVRRVEAGKISCWLPADFWDRPATSSAELRVFHGRPRVAALDWPARQVRLTSLAPNPARPGDSIILTSKGQIARVRLNGKPADIVPAAPGQMTPGQVSLKLPDGIVTSSGYNVVAEDANGAQTWPVALHVEVPDAIRPRLLSATFAPTTLHVGETLAVTFTVRNNLPTNAALLHDARLPAVYEETQAWGDFIQEREAGTLHLRVTSDHPGDHESGSWPFLFGFDKTKLLPGETVTLTGKIRLKTPGEHEFRVGLVATGIRFLDDNAFRTKITVLP